MALLEAGNQCINGAEDFKGSVLGTEEIDGAFLMSLLEESSQGELAMMNDNERLRSVIRSLEAEINPDIIMDYDCEYLCPEMLLQSDEEYIDELISVEYLEDYDCSIQGLDSNFRLADDHMQDMVPSSTSDDDGMNWYIENEMEGVIEFGDHDIRDFTQICYGLMPLEDHSHGSLWQ